jgi:single-strand DNA-binding protein
MLNYCNEQRLWHLTDAAYNTMGYTLALIVYPPAKEPTMYQQLILIGHLGTEPEMRYTSSGVPVTNFNLAVSKRWTNAEGQAQDKTTWFRVSLWRRQAEIASQYLAKGHRVMIVGEVDLARPWTDRDGNQRATIEVTANELKLMENRAANGNGDHEATAPEIAVAPESAGEKALPF